MKTLRGVTSSINAPAPQHYKDVKAYPQNTMNQCPFLIGYLRFKKEMNLITFHINFYFSRKWKSAVGDAGVNFPLSLSLPPISHINSLHRRIIFNYWKTLQRRFPLVASRSFTQSTKLIEWQQTVTAQRRLRSQREFPNNACLTD